MLIFEHEEDGLGKFDTQEIDLVIRDWMHGIGDFARTSFIQNVPIQSGRTLEHISESRVNKIGGNFWTVSVGIEPIPPSHPGESPDYPKYFEEGTGFFGDRGDFITPEHGNVMAFEKASGETVFTRWTVGQPPQHILDQVDTETNAYIEATKAEVVAKISALIG